MDFLHKITSFISFAQIWQLSLVFFIIILCHKAVRVLGIKQLETISLAFICNLLYIIFDFLSARKSPFYPFVNIENSILAVLAVLFDLTTTLFFLLAMLSWFYKTDLRLIRWGATWADVSIFHHSDKSRKSLFAVLLPYCFIVLGLVIVKFDTENVYIQIGRTLYAFCGLIAVFWLFRKWETLFRASRRMSGGFLAWAILQWLNAFSGLMGKDYTQMFGFSGSLLAKFAIISGLFSLYVAFALNTAREREAERVKKEEFYRSSLHFKDILANTFHELNFPLWNLGSAMTKLSRNLSRLARIHYSEVENQYEQVRAIISVAKISYSPNDDISDLPREYDLNVSRETRVVKVNNLLAFAIQSIKGVYKDKVQILREYGGKCFIECVPSETIQVFLNLLKNAVEAYPPATQKRKIRVKSYLSKATHTDFRYVIVEIEDFGSGVAEKYRNTMWNAGITSKETDEENTVRGRGLFIVKDFIDKTSGARIDFISPSQKTETGEGFGTMFTILFPRKGILENAKPSTAVI